MSYKPYPAYKPSDIGWLGGIPEHWDLRRLKYSGAIVMGQSPKSEDYSYDSEGLPFLQGNAEFAKKHPVARLVCETASKVAPEGALLISVRAPVGALNIADRDYGIGRGLCAVLVRPDTLLQAFTWYLFQLIREELLSIATGSTYEAVTADQVAALKTPTPPIDEQRAIAAFLDRETARIDALIEKKQRQIELLQEKRAAIINHAVTKGLWGMMNRFKDSGIEWLGEIPEHWEIKQLKFAVTFQRGHDLPLDDRIDGDVPILTSAGPSAWHNQAAAHGPGIVTGRYGTIGTFYLVEEDYWPLNTTLYSIDLRGNEPRFLWYMLQPLTELFLLNSAKSAVPGVDRKDLHMIPVTVPSLDEQKNIASYLDGETARIDRLIDKVRRSVDLLREYRTALISAAVTGKIDVREEVA